MDSPSASADREAWQCEVWKKDKYIEVGSNEDGALAYELGHRRRQVSDSHQSKEMISMAMHETRASGDTFIERYVMNSGMGLFLASQGRWRAFQLASKDAPAV